MSSPNNQHTSHNHVGRFMVAIGAIIELQNTGKILLIQRHDSLDWHNGEWEIVYGRIDQFESTEEGLIHEVREEVGLTDIQIGDTLRVWHIFRGERAKENDLIGVTYHCHTQTEKITISDEHQNYKWVTPEEALTLVKVEGIRTELKNFIELQKKKQLQVDKKIIQIGAGALIFNKEGKLLLGKRGPQARNEIGKWEIPGGGIEYGEKVEDGLKREVQEELGIDIEVQEMLQLCDHILVYEGQHWISPTYICRLTKGTPTIQEPEKCTEIGWFTIDEAEKLDLSIVTAEDIRILKKRNAQAR